jgi:hypothetical protein
MKINGIILVILSISVLLVPKGKETTDDDASRFNNMGVWQGVATE